MKITYDNGRWICETNYPNGTSILYGYNRLDMILTAIKAKFEYETSKS
jgi:hypothetical protein